MISASAGSSAMAASSISRGTSGKKKDSPVRSTYGTPPGASRRGGKRRWSPSPTRPSRGPGARPRRGRSRRARPARPRCTSPRGAGRRSATAPAVAARSRASGRAARSPRPGRRRALRPLGSPRTCVPAAGPARPGVRGAIFRPRRSASKCWSEAKEKTRPPIGSPSTISGRQTVANVGSALCPRAG